MKVGQIIGVDFGTSNFLAYIKDKGTLVCEPAVAAAERGSGRIVAIGEDAQQKMKEFPERFDAVYPVSAGLITDYQMAADMLTVFLKKLCAGRFLKPKITAGIPIRAGEVAERAMLNAVLDAGAISVTPLREPFAAAAGIGLDLSSDKSVMIIDIGGGTTDVSILSMGKVAVGTSTEAAGKKMDWEVARFIRSETGLEVGERTAEQIKINGGYMMPQRKNAVLRIHGRSIKSGLPEFAEISSGAFPEVLRPVAEEIAEAAVRVLERAPGEIADEITETGIYLTGGGSAMDGMSEYLSKRLRIPCHNVKNPLHSVAVGAGMWE